MTTTSGDPLDRGVLRQLPYGYDVRCELVGSDGVASLVNPATLDARSSAGPTPAPSRRRWKVRFGATLPRRAPGVDQRPAPGRDRRPERLGRLRRDRASPRPASRPSGPASGSRSTTSRSRTSTARPGRRRPARRHDEDRARPVHVPDDAAAWSCPGWSPTSATSSSSCRRARTSCRSSCTRGRTGRRSRRSRPRSPRRASRSLDPAALPLVRPGRGRAAGGGPLLEAGDRDRRRAGRDRDELRVQRPARSRRAGPRRCSGSRSRSCSRSSSGRGSSSASSRTRTTSSRTARSPPTWSAGINSPNVSYLYCAPHTFHMGGDVAGILEHAGRPASPTSTSRTRSTTAPRPVCATSSIRRATPARIHQHLDIGQGEVTGTRFFETLGRMRFDGIMTVCVFAWEERARESSLAQPRRDPSPHRRPGRTSGDADGHPPAGPDRSPNRPSPTSAVGEPQSADNAVHSRPAALVLLALLSFVWGVHWVIVKIGLEYLPPFTYAALRVASALATTVVLLGLGRRLRRPRARTCRSCCRSGSARSWPAS